MPDDEKNAGRRKERSGNALKENLKIKYKYFLQNHFFCNIEFKLIPVTKPIPVENTPLIKDISLSVFHPPQA